MTTSLQITDKRSKPVYAYQIPVGSACIMPDTKKVYQRIEYGNDIVRKDIEGYILFVEQPSGRLVCMSDEGVPVIPVELTVHVVINDPPTWA